MVAGGPTCTRCGGRAARWNARICGACYEAVRHERSVTGVDARFDAKTDRRSDSECWPWLGARGEKGHGIFTVRTAGRSRNVVASRFALARALGRQLQAGEHALHTCDNPPCVNPAHLWVGSIAENNADAAKKGRMHERLSADDVRALRAARAAGVMTKDLALRYGIHRGTVQKIVRGTKRYHVGAAA